MTSLCTVDASCGASCLQTMTVTECTCRRCRCLRICCCCARRAARQEESATVCSCAKEEEADKTHQPSHEFRRLSAAASSSPTNRPPPGCSSSSSSPPAPTLVRPSMVDLSSACRLSCVCLRLRRGQPAPIRPACHIRTPPPVPGTRPAIEILVVVELPGPAAVHLERLRRHGPPLLEALPRVVPERHRLLEAAAHRELARRDGVGLVLRREGSENRGASAVRTVKLLLLPVLLAADGAAARQHGRDDGGVARQVVRQDPLVPHGALARTLRTRERIRDGQVRQHRGIVTAPCGGSGAGSSSGLRCEAKQYAIGAIRHCSRRGSSSAWRAACAREAS